LQNTTKGFGSGKISKEEVGEKRRAREEKGPEKRRGQRREGAREKKGTEKKRDWRRKGTGEGKGLEKERGCSWHQNSPLAVARGSLTLSKAWGCCRCR
jgi:hypothetical protein